LILADRFDYTEEYLRRCRDALDEALESIPFYRRWRKYDPGPSASLDERYDAMPELTKRDLRENFPRGFLPAGADLDAGLDAGEVEYTYTSGTTSEKAVNLLEPGWWDRSEAASWKLNGTLARMEYPPAREAKLASSLNVGISCEEDLPMDHRILGRTLYLNEKTNVLQWRPRHLARMARELDEYRPAVLEANPSLLARLAWWAADTGTELYSPQAVVFTYELPSRLHLEAIRKVLSSPFVSSYGSTETGFVLESCEAGRLHQNTASCRVDFRPLKKEFGGPELGKLLITPFGSRWSRIVRFDAGDLVRLHGGAACACGRGEGFLADAVEGRVSNSTFAADGALVTTKTLDDALARVPGLRDYCLVQTARTSYRLEAVLERARPGAEDDLRGALEGVYGRGEFAVALKDSIFPGPAGKYRRTCAEFSVDWKELFA